MNRSLALIGFGANLSSLAGPPQTTLRQALSDLAQAPGCRLQAVSRFYRSPAWPPGSGPDFVNGCALVDSDQTAEGLLALLHRIEAKLGRKRHQRWGARVIDLDLLAMGDMLRPDPATQAHWRALPAQKQQSETPEQLILPHPRLQDRGFVLLPLAEIAPGWRHPATGRDVAQMLAALPADARQGVVPLTPAKAG